MVAIVLAGLCVLGLFMFICFFEVIHLINDLNEKLESYEKLLDLTNQEEYEITDIQEEDGGYELHIQTID